jgi:hypothetical protein
MRLVRVVSFNKVVAVKNIPSNHIFFPCALARRRPLVPFVVLPVDVLAFHIGLKPSLELAQQRQ